VRERLAVAFHEGTHRSAVLSDTLARIAPLLPAMGITRAGDITGLDRIGIPTWIAVRPAAKLLTVSSGKGLSHGAARVSALMESVEHWHTEWPAEVFRRTSTVELMREHSPFLAVHELPDYEPGPYFTDRRVLDWVLSESLPDGTRAWLPASTAFFTDPMLTLWSANGLASGNHMIEATLHGLYEVIERDSVARLIRGGVSLPRGQSRVVDLDTLPAGPLTELRDRLCRARVGLTLIWVESIVPVTTFWAVLVDPASPFPSTYVNMGHGSHLCPSVAATRAITEAAQSRLAFIHGSREDLLPGAYQFKPSIDRIRTFFTNRRGDLSWSTLVDRSNGDLSVDLDTVLNGLYVAGYTRVFRVDLTQARFDIPVVKVVVPGLSGLSWSKPGGSRTSTEGTRSGSANRGSP